MQNNYFDGNNDNYTEGNPSGRRKDMVKVKMVCRMVNDGCPNIAPAPASHVQLVPISIPMVFTPYIPEQAPLMQFDDEQY